DRIVFGADVPVHPLPADDLHLRDAGDPAGGEDRGGEQVTRRRERLYGLMAEFASPHDLLAAASSARSTGYRSLDAFTPFPIEELSEALGHPPSRVPMLVLIGGVIGAFTGYGLQYWISAIAYPLNVGGRPYNSWPAFIP